MLKYRDQLIAIDITDIKCFSKLFRPEKINAVGKNIENKRNLTLHYDQRMQFKRLRLQFDNVTDWLPSFHF